MQLKKHGIVLVSALSVLPIAAAAADEECCPSDGNGVRMMQSLATTSAAPPECCPSGGNGVASSTGLGLAQPNTIDLSTYPGWHAYAFVRDGIRYVQINDDSGKVHAAIATANGAMLILPMGEDEVRRVNALPAGRPIYDDSTVAIAPMVTPAGAIIWLVKAPR